MDSIISNTHKPEIMNLDYLGLHTEEILEEGIIIKTPTEHIEVATSVENILMMCSNSVLTIIECKKEYPLECKDTTRYFKGSTLKRIFSFAVHYVNQVKEQEKFHVKHIMENPEDFSYDYTTGFPDNVLKLS